MDLIDLDELRAAMAHAGVGSTTREALSWIAGHVNARLEHAVEAIVERMLRPRDPMED